MQRRQMLKAGSLVVAGAAVPAAALAAVSDPVRLVPTTGEPVRHWNVLAPVPSLVLEPGTHRLQEWVASHACRRWTCGNSGGGGLQHGSAAAYTGNVWPLVLAAYVAEAILPEMEIRDHMAASPATGESPLVWTPDHAALIAAHGPERALSLAWDEFCRRGDAVVSAAFASILQDLHKRGAA